LPGPDGPRSRTCAARGHGLYYALVKEEASAPRTRRAARAGEAGLDVGSYPRHPLHHSLVRIRDGSGAIRGAGVLAAPTLVCTCAHVVCDALGLPRSHADCPDAPVSVDFPIDAGPPVNAAVVAWRPGAGEPDLAVLELAGPRRRPVRPARLLASGLLHGGTFETYGFPDTADDAGVWAEGTFGGDRSDGTIQLQSPAAGYRVQPGYSGAAVWDRERRGVAGIVVSADERRGAAVLLPVDRILPAHEGLSSAGSVGRYGGLTLAGRGDDDWHLEDFFEEYLGTPLRPKAFGGRESTLAALDDWLADPGRPYALIVAEAGRGKSAVLAHWAVELAESELASVAFAPLSVRFNTSGRLEFLTMLGRRLRYLSATSQLEEPTTPVGWEAEVKRVLRRGLDSPDRPLVIVIDALDEASGWRFEELRLPEPPPGVKVALSARLAARSAEDWIRMLGVEALTSPLPLPPLGSREILQVLRHATLPRFDVGLDRVASVLEELTEGDPLLLQAYLRDLRDDGERVMRIAELERHEPGWYAYVDEWWKDLQRQWDDSPGVNQADARAKAEMLLEILATALGPIGPNDIVAVARAPLDGGAAVEQAVAAIERFLIAQGRGDQRRYVYSHPRLRQFFLERWMVDKDRRAWRTRFLTHGRETFERLVQAMPAHEASAYAVRHYRDHLREALDTASLDAETGAAETLGMYLQDLVCEPWQRASQAHEGNDDRFLSDVDEAWRHAELQQQEAPGPNQSSWLLRALRCTLVTASAETISGNAPPELVAALAAHGIWTRTAAVAYARRVGERRNAPDALERLAPLLAASGPAADALEAAGAIASSSRRGHALALVSRALAERGRAVEALEAAQAVPDPAHRADSLAAIAARLPPFLSSRAQRDALAAAGEIGDVFDRDDTLARVLPQLTGTQPLQVLALAVAIADEELRDEALEDLADAYREDGQGGAAREVACRIAEPIRRSRTLLRSADGDPELLAEARQAAKSARGTEGILAVLHVLGASPPDVREALGRRAEDLAGRLAPEVAYAEREFVPVGAVVAELFAAEDALEPARREHARDVVAMLARAPDADERMAELLPVFAEVGLHAHAERALDAIAGRGPRDHAAGAICRIALARGDAEAASRVARSIQDPVLCAHHLNQVPRLAPDPAAAVAERLGELARLSPLSARILALGDLAAASPDAVRADVLAELLEATRAAGEGWLADDARLQATRELARSGLLPEARRLAAAIEHAPTRTTALADLAPEIAAAGDVGAALAAIEAIPTAERQLLLERVIESLADVAPAKAMAVLAQVTDPVARRRLHAELAPALAETGQGELALQAIESIDEVDEQLAVLVRFAGPLVEALGVETVHTWAAEHLPLTHTIRVWIALAQEAPDTQARDLLRGALESARRISDEAWQHRAMAALAREAAAAGEPERAWRIIDSIGDPGARLSARVDRLTAGEVEITEADVLTVIEDAARTRPPAATHPLQQLVIRLSGEDGELALRAATALEDPGARCDALLTIARAAPAPGGESLARRALRHAIEAADDLENAESRDGVLEVAIEELVRFGDPTEASAVMNEIRSYRAGDAALEKIIPAFMATGDIDGAWRRALDLRDPIARGRWFARIAPALGAKRAEGLLAALELLPALPDDLVLELLAELAPTLRRHGLDDQAVQVARSIKDVRKRIAASLEATRARAAGATAEDLDAIRLTLAETEAESDPSLFARSVSTLGVRGALELLRPSVDTIARAAAQLEAPQRGQLLLRLLKTPSERARWSIRHNGLAEAALPLARRTLAPRDEITALMQMADFRDPPPEALLERLQELLETDTAPEGELVAAVIALWQRSGRPERAVAAASLLAAPEDRAAALVQSARESRAEARHDWLADAASALADAQEGPRKDLVGRQLVVALIEAGRPAEAHAAARDIRDPWHKAHALSALGSPAAALELLEATSSTEASPFDRALLARLRLMQGDADGALAALGALSAQDIPLIGYAESVPATARREFVERLLPQGAEAPVARSLARQGLAPEVVDVLSRRGGMTQAEGFAAVLDEYAAGIPDPDVLRAMVRHLSRASMSLFGSVLPYRLARLVGSAGHLDDVRTLVRFVDAETASEMLTQAAARIADPEEALAIIQGVPDPRARDRALERLARTEGAASVADRIVDAAEDPRIAARILIAAASAGPDPEHLIRATAKIAAVPDAHERFNAWHHLSAVTQKLGRDAATTVWAAATRELAARGRPQLLSDLPAIAPLFAHIAPDAFEAAAGEIQAVGRWYP
jgi:hypothetical protein